MATERTAERILRSHLSAIDKHVSTIADTIEHQQYVFGTAEVLQREITTIPPRAIEGFRIVLLIVQTLEDALIEAILGKGSHHSGGHLSLIRFLGL